MSLGDWISGGEPEHTETFVRVRAGRTPDPYNPDRTVEDWGNPDEAEFAGAWSSSGSSFGADAVREPLSTSKVITVFDPEADIVAGDRVRAADGSVFTVTGRPGSDVNPWTGWRPTRVLTVEERRG